MKWVQLSCFLVIFLIITNLALIFAPPVVGASSAPSIGAVAGVLQHGASVTISGTGFGTKTPAAPLKYDDFDRGINGTVLTGWSLSIGGPSGANYPQFSSTVHRPNSRMSARAI